MTFLTLFGLRNLGEISLTLFPYKLFSHSFSLSSVDLYLFLKLQNLDSKVLSVYLVSLLSSTSLSNLLLAIPLGHTEDRILR